MSSDTHSKPTRVLFLCHDGKIYGSQKSLALLVEHLPRDKYQIFVSFSRPGPLMELFLSYPHVTVLSHERIQGVKHAKRSLLKRVGDVASVFLNMGRVLPLVWMIWQYRIDVVHTNSLVSLEGAVAARLAGVPHVWHIRELFKDYNPRFHLILGKAFTKALVHHFSSRVICISDYVRRQFEPYVQQSPRKYRTLYNAIACEPSSTLANEQEMPLSDELNLVYTGRVSDGKRFQDVLDAFCLLKERWNGQMPFRLKVYGDFICPRFEGMVRQTIEDHGLAEHLALLGYRDSMDECLSGMDLLLMPSSTEAFGRTMLEGLVRGIPVVVSRSGAPLEVVEEGQSGFFHEPNDARDLAACLERIYEGRERISAMRTQCVQRVQEKFELSQQIAQLDALYDEVLGRSPSVR